MSSLPPCADVSCGISVAARPLALQTWESEDACQLAEIVWWGFLHFLRYARAFVDTGLATTLILISRACLLTDRNYIEVFNLGLWSHARTFSVTFFNFSCLAFLKLIIYILFSLRLGIFYLKKEVCNQTRCFTLLFWWHRKVNHRWLYQK